MNWDATDEAWEDYHPYKDENMSELAEETEKLENEAVEEAWVEEYQAKDLDDIFEYLEAKKKLVGVIHKIVIERSMYEGNKYDFRWW